MNDDLVQAVKETYRKFAHSPLSDEQAAIVARALRRFRYVSSSLLDNPSAVMRDAAKLRAYRQVIYPCDIVELRRILETGFVEPAQDSAVFFSSRFADRYLRRYGVFLCLNSKELRVESEMGGVVAASPRIDDTLLYVQVNQPVRCGATDDARRIVRDTRPGLPCLVSNAVPGIAAYNPRLTGRFNLRQHAGE